MRLVSTRSLCSGAALAAVALLAGACNNDSTSPNPTPVTATFTVDASAAFAFEALGVPAQAVTVADPTTSSAWDIAIFATTVMLNGGAAGPGGVEGTCLCQNAAATNAEVQAMTADNQLAVFEGVTAAEIPAAASFTGDQLAPAIAGWASAAGVGATPTPSRSWIIREGSPTVVLAKFAVTNIQNATAANAGSITFQYAVQPSAGAAFGAPVSKTVDVSGGPVFFDITTGAVTTAANWDLEFEGWNIRVNGGVSGTGTVKAVLDATTPFASIDAPYAASAPAQAYSVDAFSGVFKANPWYRYNITGSDNQIWPTFNVYLVRRGTAVYKVQLVSYYGANAAPRQVTVRYAKLTN
jgi:hypothetical protein